MTSPPATDPGRLRSVDAYRGFVMLLMASGGIATFGYLIGYDDGLMSIPLELLARQLDHVGWRGCSLWDLIQPSFMFLVGVSLSLSYSRRQAHGEKWLHLLGHALVRSAVLVLLGVFLAWLGGPQKNYSFTNVLAQIGLGYTFAFLVLGRPLAVQLGVALVILLGDWLLFRLYPLPGRGFAQALTAPTNSSSS